MWPTIYIPGSSADGFVSGQSYATCGVTSFTSSISIPTPAEAVDGATQLIIFDIKHSVGATISLPDDTDSNWRRSFDSNRVPLSASAQYGEKGQYIFWRVYDSSYSDAAISASSGGVQAAYTSVILNNPNTADRWFSAYVHQADLAAGGRRWDTPATGMEVANSGDLLIFASSPAGTLLSANEPDSADVEFACTPTFVAAGAGNTGHTIAGLETYARTANNLLTYCPSLDAAGWTTVGLTRSAGTMGDTRLTANTGSGRHYVEQEVDLVAGQTYLFAATAIQYAGTNPYPTFWMTYVKPDTTEHGCGMRFGSGEVEMTNSTEVRWDTGVGKPAWGNRGGYGGELSFHITPSASGTYKMRIYVTPTQGFVTVTQPDEDSAAGGSNQFAEISGLVLQKGQAVEQMAHYIETTSAPVAVGAHPGVLFPIPVCNQTSGYKSWSAIVMRRAGGRRPVCRLFAPRLDIISMSFSDTAILNTRERNSATGGYQALGTTHVVYSDLAQKKFYLELTVDSLGSGGTRDEYSIGFCLHGGLQDHEGTGTIPGDNVGQYAYTSTGKTYTDGALDGSTISAWAASDVIGAGIDFTNWEITYYLNGTLVKTQSITNDAYRTGLWHGHFGVRGPSTGDYQWRATYNFRGPFGGRKPSGFVAFDFDNELT